MGTRLCAFDVSSGRCLPVRGKICYSYGKKSAFQKMEGASHFDFG